MHREAADRLPQAQLMGSSAESASKASRMTRATTLSISSRPAILAATHCSGQRRTKPPSRLARLFLQRPHCSALVANRCAVYQRRHLRPVRTLGSVAKNRPWHRHQLGVRRRCVHHRLRRLQRTRIGSCLRSVTRHLHPPCITPHRRISSDRQHTYRTPQSCRPTGSGSPPRWRRLQSGLRGNTCSTLLTHREAHQPDLVWRSTVRSPLRRTRASSSRVFERAPSHRWRGSQTAPSSSPSAVSHALGPG